jgi:hypothetical protein
MEMTGAYASAVTVSIPIFVLAAGAEARAVRERLKRPDEQWERDFAAYRAEHELNMAGRPSQVFGFMRQAPAVSRLYVAERLLAIGSALVWLAVFILLAVAEVLSLVWLGDGSPAGDTGLATFALVAVIIAMAALIVAPAAYLLVPLALPFDLVPKGLREEFKTKLAPGQGARGFFKLAFSEFEGAMDRAAEKLERDAAPPEPPDPPATQERPGA